MKFGVQLYSLRDEIATRGLEPVLKMVADAGYDCVEFAGFYDLTPIEVKNLLDKYGLEGISAHIGIDKIAEQLDYIDVIGIKSVYIPWVSFEELDTDLDGLVAKINAIKPELDKRNVLFGYHNHAHEYRDGKDLIYNLLSKTEDFYSEIDTFWVKAAGLEPTDMMKKYASRLSCLHIKELDLGGDTKKPNPIVGLGSVGFEKVFALANEMGINLAILEVENLPCDSASYLKQSYQNMKKFSENK